MLNPQHQKKLLPIKTNHLVELSDADIVSLQTAIISSNQREILEICVHFISSTSNPLRVVQELIQFYGKDWICASTMPHRYDLMPYSKQIWDQLCILANQQQNDEQLLRNFYSSKKKLNHLKGKLQNGTITTLEEVSQALAACFFSTK